MASLGFFKTFLAAFVVVALPAFFVLGRVAWLRERKGWKTNVAVLAVAAGLGFRSGTETVREYAEAAVEDLRRNPADETRMRYLVGDYLPFLRSLRSEPSPRALAEAERIAAQGPACPAAMARRLLGRGDDVAAACR